MSSQTKAPSSLLTASPRAHADVPGERERLMAEFSITYNGRQYEYDVYRYDRLADAVAYARLRRPRLSESTPLRHVVEAPTESERKLMAKLFITFDDGVYRLGDFRYDRLADAVNYARLKGGFRSAFDWRHQST